MANQVIVGAAVEKIFHDVYVTLLNRGKLNEKFNNPNIDYMVRAYRIDNYITVLIKDGYNNTMSVGVSKRMHKDKFNYEVGLKIAFSRALTSEFTFYDLDS